MTPAEREIKRRISELKRELRQADDVWKFALENRLDEALHIRELVKREGMISLSQLKRVEAMRKK